MASANPYAAPRAALNDHADGTGPRRPGWVWAISVFLAFGVVFGTLGSVVAMTGMGGPETAAATQHFVPLDHAVGLLNIAISAVGAVQFFRLRRQALALFVTAFALGLLYFSGSMLLRPSYREMFDAAAILSMAVGWLVNVAIIAYAWKLRRRGILC